MIRWETGKVVYDLTCAMLRRLFCRMAEYGGAIEAPAEMLCAYTSEIAATACGITNDENIVAAEHIEAFLIAADESRLEPIRVWFCDTIVLVKDDESDASGLRCLPGEGGDGRYCQMWDDETRTMESSSEDC